MMSRTLLLPRLRRLVRLVELRRLAADVFDDGPVFRLSVDGLFGGLPGLVRAALRLVGFLLDVIGHGIGGSYSVSSCVKSGPAGGRGRLILVVS